MKTALLLAGAALLPAVASSQSVEEFVLPILQSDPVNPNAWGSGVAVHGDWMVMAGYDYSFYKPQVFRRSPLGRWDFHQELNVNASGGIAGAFVPDALIQVHGDRMVVSAGAFQTSRVETYKYFEVVDLWVGVGTLWPATPGGEFGAHLDLSPDGSKLTVTQGELGLVHLYDWDPIDGWQPDTILEAPAAASAFAASACVDGDLVLVSGSQGGGDTCFAFERDTTTGVWAYEYSFPTTYASVGELEGDLAAGRDRYGFWVATRTGSGPFQESYNEGLASSSDWPRSGAPDFEDGVLVVGSPLSSTSGRIFVYQDVACAGGFVRTHEFATPQKGLGPGQQAYFGYGVDLEGGVVFGGVPRISEPGTSEPYNIGGVGVFELPLDCNGNGIPDICDIAAGEPDTDGDGFPDTCDQIGQRYCDPNVAHSGNDNAVVLVEGSASALANNVHLSMIDLPKNQFGIFLAGRNPASVPMAGGSPGTLCVGAPIARLQSVLQGTSGQEGRLNFTLDTQAIPLSTGDAAILPGETWFFQGWFRDNGSSGFTDALSVSFF